VNRQSSRASQATIACNGGISRGRKFDSTCRARGTTGVVGIAATLRERTRALLASVPVSKANFPQNAQTPHGNRGTTSHIHIHTHTHTHTHIYMFTGTTLRNTVNKCPNHTHRLTEQDSQFSLAGDDENVPLPHTVHVTRPTASPIFPSGHASHCSSSP
jgi:hypothetical protein